VLEGRHELFESVWAAVRERRLAVVPHTLVGVEFGCIGWEALHVQAGMALEKGLDLLASMDAAAVPEQDDRTWNLSEQVAQEEHDLGLRDVLPVQVEVEADVLASEAHGDRRDRRDPVVTVAVPDDRGLAAWSPGTADVRDQQEPAFVQEGQVRPQPLGFFLSLLLFPWIELTAGEAVG
jgi:hypothetical protein